MVMSSYITATDEMSAFNRRRIFASPRPLSFMNPSAKAKTSGLPAMLPPAK